MVASSETELSDRLAKLNVREPIHDTKGAAVLFDQIFSEPIAVWSQPIELWLTQHAPTYHGTPILGALEYASRGVDNYTTSLETESMEAFKLMYPGATVPNDGLRHDQTNFQVFVKPPHKQHAQELDGLIFLRDKAAIVSVKSRFGPSELHELVALLYGVSTADAAAAVLGKTKSPDLSKCPIVDLSAWHIENDKRVLVPIRDVLRPPLYRAPNPKLTLFGYAVSPIFKPGDWLRSAARIKAVRFYQRVGRLALKRL